MDQSGDLGIKAEYLLGGGKNNGLGLEQGKQVPRLHAQQQEHGREIRDHLRGLKWRIDLR